MYRNVYHGTVDTNNITESFNNVFRTRYNALRPDTTLVSLVQLLIKVVFPEQEKEYFVKTAQCSTNYRKPRYPIPTFLLDRPHHIQEQCILHLEAAKRIPHEHTQNVDDSRGKFLMKAHNPDNPSITHYTVDIPQGNCTCPSFTHDHIPCKHMFAVFQLYPEWSWSNLPPVLLNAPHMTLEALPEDTPHDDPENTDTIAPDDTTSMETNLSMPATVIPSASSRASQMYREQKKTIDIFSKASAIIHTIEDTELLKSVQHYGDILHNVLTNAATTSAMSGDIPAEHN